MTIDEYWAAIHQLRLTPTKVSTVFRTEFGDVQRVPSPVDQTEAQRRETISHIRFMVLGEPSESVRQ